MKNFIENVVAIFDIYGNIIQFIDNNVVVSYTNFDQRAITKCLSDQPSHPKSSTIILKL